MPLLVGVMDAFNDLEYETVVVMGPRQSGKTEAALINPFLYYCLYLGKDVLILYPEMNTAKEKWNNVIYPAIKAQPHLAALDPPKNDRGSIISGRRFLNGTALYMAGAESLAILTSKSVEVVLCDESDFIKTPKTGRSDYMDRIEMAIGRSDAYPMTRRVAILCTATTPNGRIFKEFLEGDQRTPWVRCPRCGEWFVFQQDFELDRLLGHEVEKGAKGGLSYDSSSVATAKKSATYICHHCHEHLHEMDRIEMLRDSRWVRNGETISGDGVITGDVEPNTKASFWYNRFYVPFFSLGVIARDHMNSLRSAEKSKDYQQHALTIPFSDPDVEIVEVNDAMIKSHIGNHAKGVVPKDADTLVMAVDVHRRVLYYVVMAFKKADGSSYLVDEDHIEVMTPDATGRGVSKEEEQAIFSALSEIYAMEEEGWRYAGSDDMVRPVLVGVDHGYAKDAVGGFVRSAGQNKWMAIKGWSTSNNERFKLPTLKTKKKREANDITTAHAFSKVGQDRVRVVHANADWSKKMVYRGLQIAAGAPGSLTIHRAIRQAYGDHLRAEQFVTDEHGGTWLQTRKNNHYLDCSHMCFHLAEIAGVNFAKRVAKKKVEKKPRAAMPPKRRKRMNRLDIRNIDRR